MSYRGQRRYGNSPITPTQFTNVVKVGYGFSLGHWLFRLTLRGAREAWALFCMIMIVAIGGVATLVAPMLKSLPDDNRTVLMIIILLVTALITSYLTYRIFRWVGIKAFQWVERL